jgi:hypothetical protein
MGVLEQACAQGGSLLISTGAHDEIDALQKDRAAGRKIGIGAANLWE